MERLWRNEEEREVRRWRLSHGAVFLTMALLSLFIVGFLVVDGWEFLKAISVTQRAVTNPHGAQSKP
jgi:ABC-type phosphate transport system permease subunit